MKKFGKSSQTIAFVILKIAFVVLIMVLVTSFNSVLSLVDEVVAAENETKIDIVNEGEENKEEDNKENEITDISNYTVTLSQTSYTYDGTKKIPDVTIKNEAEEIIPEENYKVTYSNNKKVGAAVVTITGIGNFSGVLTASFTINPENTKITSAKVGARSITLTWDKIKKQVTGYQIQYSTSSEFKDAKTETKKIKDHKITTKKISKLKKNKTYYVRIRTYKEVDGKKYYSAWSSVKTRVTGTGKLKTSGNKKYYVYQDGTKAKHTFITIGKKTYYFDKTGTMVTGWKKIKDEYYYFDRTTGVQKTDCRVDGIKLKKNGKAKASSDDVAKIKTMIRARKIYLEITDANDTKSEKLQKCFDWVIKNPYYRHRILAVARESSTWMVTYANDVFVRGSGCCVSEACAFAFLANECGYTAYVCDDTAHAWAEIDGKVYDTLFAEAKDYDKYFGTSYSTAGVVRVNKTRL